MKITLLLVGKTADNRLQSLIDEYQNRLKHYIPFEIKIVELKSRGTQEAEALIKQQEGDLILKAVTPSSDVVLLDERGKQFRSIEFADYLQKKMSAGRDLVFVVGGPFGFSQDVYDRANAQFSLSKMTFSHQMIRLLFIEQLYRAMTILRHEPYHHE